jgi:mRNA interferase HigB
VGGIAKRSLQQFWDGSCCADSRGPLQSCCARAVKATWRTPRDNKNQYASASIFASNRVVFNVGANKYRLVVKLRHRAGIVWMTFDARAVRPHRRGDRE